MHAPILLVLALLVPLPIFVPSPLNVLLVLLVYPSPLLLVTQLLLVMLVWDATLLRVSVCTISNLMALLVTTATLVPPWINATTELASVTALWFVPL
jgi:hypothetical protein